MRYRLWTVLATAAMLAAGCGQDESPNSAVKEPPLASAAALERDPHALSCGHVTNDQPAWAHATRRATVAIADGMRVRGLNRLQKTHSLYYAMTELCKGRPASHQPVDSAIEAVRDGTYRADLD